MNPELKSYEGRSVLLSDGRTLARLHFDGDRPYLINPPVGGFSNTKHYLTAAEIDELSFDKDVIRSTVSSF